MPVKICRQGALEGVELEHRPHPQKFRTPISQKKIFKPSFYYGGRKGTRRRTTVQFCCSKTGCTPVFEPVFEQSVVKYC